MRGGDARCWKRKVLETQGVGMLLHPSSLGTFAIVSHWCTVSGVRGVGPPLRQGTAQGQVRAPVQAPVTARGRAQVLAEVQPWAPPLAQV